VHGQLSNFARNPKLKDKTAILRLLENAATELEHARALVAGEKEDASPFAVEDENSSTPTGERQSVPRTSKL